MGACLGSRQALLDFPQLPENGGESERDGNSEKEIVCGDGNGGTRDNDQDNSHADLQGGCEERMPIPVLSCLFSCVKSVRYQTGKKSTRECTGGSVALLEGNDRELELESQGAESQ